MIEERLGTSKSWSISADKANNFCKWYTLYLAHHGRVLTDVFKKPSDYLRKKWYRRVIMMDATMNDKEDIFFAGTTDCCPTIVSYGRSSFISAIDYEVMFSNTKLQVLQVTTNDGRVYEYYHVGPIYVGEVPWYHTAENFERRNKYVTQVILEEQNR